MGDQDIVKRVLEFMLREELEECTLNSLVSSLSLPHNNPNFQKLLLLKKLESDAISRNSISETTLEWLEILEENDFRQGIRMVSDTMKRAYCAVAVECTLKHLANGDDSNRKILFEAVKRLWKGRIEKMEKVLEKGGLGSEELWNWRDEIVAALWDDSLYEAVVKKIRIGLNAVDAVRAYVREEKEKMRSDLAAKRVVDGGDGVNQFLGEPSRRREIIILSDSDDEIAVEPSNSRSGNSPLNREVTGVREALDLRVPSRRPIDVAPRNRDGYLNKRRTRRDWTRREEAALRAGVRRFGKGSWKCILNEYGDRLGGRTNVDLKDKWRNMSKHLKTRRERRCWTPTEEATLRAGVRRCGKGNWKRILYEYRDKLGGRTDVDLNDKWRNMTK